MKSTLRQIRLSPKKAQLIASIIRWLDVVKALSTLKFLDKKWADIMYKILESAIANAENNFSQKKWDLLILKALVSPWTTYKRWMSRSKWRVFSILKRTSHITIELWLKTIDINNQDSNKKSTGINEKVEKISSKKINNSVKKVASDENENSAKGSKTTVKKVVKNSKNTKI